MTELHYRILGELADGREWKIDPLYEKVKSWIGQSYTEILVDLQEGGYIKMSGETGKATFAITESGLTKLAERNRPRHRSI